MTLELLIKVLKALLPDLTFEQVLREAQRRLRGHLTRKEREELARLELEARKRGAP